MNSCAEAELTALMRNDHHHVTLMQSSHLCNLPIQYSHKLLIEIMTPLHLFAFIGSAAALDALTLPLSESDLIFMGSVNSLAHFHGLFVCCPC